MRYKTGRVGISNGAVITFIVTAPWVFLTLPAIALDTADALAWTQPLLGGVTALMSVYIIYYIMKHMPGDLFDISHSLLGPVGAWIILLACLSTFAFDAFILLREFSENTLETALQHMEFSQAIIWYALIAGILTYIGFEGLSRAAYLLLPFGVFALLSVWLLNIPNYNLNHLFPWQGTGLGVVIPAGILNAGSFSGVLWIAVLAPVLQNTKTVWQSTLLGLTGSILIRSITVFAFTILFGYSVGREKILPFFEMARLVYLSRYIQRIEAIFILLWVIFGVLAIAINLYIVLYIITRLFNMPNLHPLIPLAVMIFAQLSMIPVDVTATIQLNQFVLKTIKPGVVFGIPLILLTAFLIKTRTGRKRVCATD